MRGYNFTERVRIVLGVARAEALRLDCRYVSPGHIVLGILGQRHNVAAAILTRLGVTAEVISLRETEIRMRWGSPQDAGPVVHLPYTSAAKRALEYAMDEASRLGHPSIEPEDLLLGIVHDEKSDTAKLLAEHGATLDHVRTEVERLRPPSQ